MRTIKKRWFRFRGLRLLSDCVDGRWERLEVLSWRFGASATRSGKAVVALVALG